MTLFRVVGGQAGRKGYSLGSEVRLHDFGESIVAVEASSSIV